MAPTLCPKHDSALRAGLAARGLGHLFRPRLESELLVAILEEPDSPGPERAEDFDPVAAAMLHVGNIVEQFDLVSYFDWRTACPACRARRLDVIGLAADGSRDLYDRLTGGHA